MTLITGVDASVLISKLSRLDVLYGSKYFCRYIMYSESKDQ